MKQQKWIIFISLWLASTVAAYGQYQLNVYALEIMAEYGISTSAFASLFTAPMAPAIFLSVAAGRLSDKFGSGKVIFAGLAITALGFIGRYFLHGYIALWICMALSGAASITVNVNSAKIIGNTMGAENTGMMMGIFTTGSMLAQTFATATSPILFGSKEAAYGFAAGYAVLILVVWLTQAKKVDTPAAQVEGKTHNSSIKEILRCKGIWFTSACLFFTLGATITLNTFLPAALVQLYGMKEETAATVASMISLGNLIGAVAGPVVYQKMRSFRMFAGLFCAVAAAGCFLGWRIQIPALSMAAYLITGIVLGGIMPIYFSMPMILKGISQENVATASGLTTTFQLAGAVIVPSWLITPIAGSNYALIFTLAGVCIVAVLVIATRLSKEME